MLTALMSAKSFSLPMLGQGKKNEGSQQHQKNRQEVLDRVREVAELSPVQTCHWSYFKNTWDQEMAEAHGVNSGQLLAEIVQKVMNDLCEGRTNAPSVFMENESKRVLSTTPGLLTPPASRR